MSIHISQPEMEQFCARTLELSRMVAIGEHLADCAECHQRFHEVFQKRRNYAPITIDLSPEKWLQDEHLDYEWLVAYADGSMESDEREMTKIHLRLCRQCREDVADFIEWRRGIEPELKIRYAIDAQTNSTNATSWWWNWSRLIERPSYAFTALLVIGAVITLAILFLAHGSNDERKQQALASPSPSVLVTKTPAVTSYTTPTPTITPASEVGPSHEPTQYRAGLIKEKAKAIVPTANPIVSLKDGDHKVVIDTNGRLSGMAGLTPELQQTVEEFLSSEDIKRPNEVADLAGNKGGLRGTENQSSFKLLSPFGAVIAENQPVFRWQPLKGAEAYRVYVSDSRGRKVADSGRLPSVETQWTLPAPFTRGEVYTWVVGAVVDGDEILSPSASEPEARFMVLREEKMRELDFLKRNINSRLALGVFYARSGMLAEAEREFQQLADDNPDSPIPYRLLRIIRSWR